jgi:F-type H+-transporting ATPase subunit gamma
MADSTAHLQRQIDSATDLHAVVRAMKAQAAASVDQYAQSVAALGDYARTVELGVAACARQSPRMVHEHDDAVHHGTGQGKSLLNMVVFGSDQGLVGRFNDTLVEVAQTQLATLSPQHTHTHVWGVGARMCASLDDAGLAVQGRFDVPATVNGITHLVSDILLRVMNTTSKPAKDLASESTPTDPEPNSDGVGKRGRSLAADTPVGVGAVGDVSDVSGLGTGRAPALYLLYNQPTGGAGYAATSHRLLPLNHAWLQGLAHQPWPTAMLAQTIGHAAPTLRALMREFVFVSIFKASAESLASENASRLAAMERADSNIEDMLGALQQRFHRLRQSKIDEELSDVMGGFKALQQQQGLDR